MLISVEHCRIEAVAEPYQPNVLGCRSLKVIYLLLEMSGISGISIQIRIRYHHSGSSMELMRTLSSAVYFIKSYNTKKL